MSMLNSFSFKYFHLAIINVQSSEICNPYCSDMAGEPLIQREKSQIYKYVLKYKNLSFMDQIYYHFNNFAILLKFKNGFQHSSSGFHTMQ
jgi:hypothetical protein